MRRILLTSAAVVAVALCVSIAAAETEKFEWTGAVAPGGTIEVKGVNGRVEAGPATGGQVEVRAVKRGRKDDPSEVRIEVVEHANGVTICAIYPDEDYRCEPGAGGLGARDDDVQVDFTVRVPSGTDFIGRTVNGGVEAESIDGNVEATTVNGDIEATATGWVEATTVNGSISVGMGRTDWDDELELKTVNGGIRVSLPDGASTDVDLKTHNGGIKSDFPVHMKGRYVKNRADGTIGGGGRMLELESVNGNLTLTRGS